MGGNRSWVYVVDKAGIVVVGIECKLVDKVGMVGIEANVKFYRSQGGQGSLSKFNNVRL